jgi:uncharacterized protein (TIGR03546 family)
MLMKYTRQKNSSVHQSILRRTFERFIKIRGRPEEIALGFALGTFIGVTPTMGIQIPVAVFFAALLKWNKISAALGVWITNPLTAPFIYSLTYMTGAKILSVNKLTNLTDDLTLSGIRMILKKAPEVLFALTAGGIVIGVPLAIVAYYLSYVVIKKNRDKIKNKLAQQKTRLANTKERINKKVRKSRKKTKI